MLVHLDDALENALPEGDLPRLNAHDLEIAKTTSHRDFHRCVRCAEWAVELLSPPEHSHVRHLLHRIEQALHELHNTGWTLEFALRPSVSGPGNHIILDEELTWVDDAMAAAKAVAEKSGWDAVPWEELIVELIAMEHSEES